MGKKYIIEIPDDKVQDFVRSTHFLMPYIMAGHIGHHDTGLPIEPYTDPDLDAIRNDAYEKGYKTAKVQCNIQAEKDLREVGERHYQKGLSDAWEAARKICTNWVLPDSVLSEIFGMDKTIDDIMKENTASEAIEKIRQYEQENLFCVGDEFENKSGERFVITKMDGKEVDRYIDENGTTYCMIAKYKVMRKTGRHFPEIAEVLRKMRENNG